MPRGLFRLERQARRLFGGWFEIGPLSTHDALINARNGPTLQTLRDQSAPGEFQDVCESRREGGGGPDQRTPRLGPQSGPSLGGYAGNGVSELSDRCVNRQLDDDFIADQVVGLPWIGDPEILAVNEKLAVESRLVAADSDLGWK